MSILACCDLLQFTFRDSRVFYNLYCRSELDTDDEVRDRATFYRSVLEAEQKPLNSAYILNGRFH